MNLYRLNYVTLPYQLNYIGFGSLVSFFIRISFIAVIAFVISKPLELLVFKAQTNEIVKNYKQQLYNSKSQYITQRFNDDKNEILSQLKNFKTQPQLTQYIPAKKAELEQLKTNYNSRIQKLQSDINDGMFFIKTLTLVNQKLPQTNIVTLFVLIIAFIPIYYRLKRLPTLGEIKYKEKYDLITTEFESFKQVYQTIFEKIGIHTSYKSRFQDSPFNREPVLELKPIIGTEKEFYSSLKKISGKENN